MSNLALSESEVSGVMIGLLDHYARFASNGMNTREFMENYSLIVSPVITASRIFDREEDFYEVLKSDRNKQVAQSNLAHEREHLRVMTKYSLCGRLGLLYVHPDDVPKPRKLNELIDLPLIPFVSESPSAVETMKRWPRNKLLEYILECHDITNPSEYDYAVLKTMSPLLEREKTPYDRKV